MSSLKEQGDLFWMHTSKNSDLNFGKIFFVVVRSFTADSNLLQPTGVCEQNTLTRHIFSCLHTLISMSHVTVAQDVLRASRHVIMRLVVRLI